MQYWHQVDIVEHSSEQQEQLPTTVQIYPLHNDDQIDHGSSATANVMCLSIVNGKIQNIRDSSQGLSKFKRSFQLPHGLPVEGEKHGAL